MEQLPRESPSLAPPPWRLSGAAVLLPSGPGVCLWVHYTASPVGAYDEWTLLRPTWRGPTVVKMLVTSEASRRAGRANWGYPKELAALNWRRIGPRVEFTAGGARRRVRALGPAWPLRLRFWTVGRHQGRIVTVPLRVRGRARIAFAGRRLAISIEAFEMEIGAVAGPAEKTETPGAG